MTADFPITYRRETLERLMPALQAGECCALIGVSGVGKTNFLQFLGRPDVRKHYWGPNQIWVVSIDSNGMVLSGRDSAYAALELMAHRLVMEAESRHLAAETVARLSALYEQAAERGDVGPALRSLERMIALLLRQEGMKILLLFDQFEDLWQSADSRLFLNLRYLRDQYKYRLAYVTMTRRELPQLRANLASVEAFYELFTSHTYGIGPLSEQDARLTLNRILARQQAAIDEERADWLIQSSRGHAGLLRALYWSLQLNPALCAEQLAAHPAILDECRKIWLGLGVEEQHAVRAIARGAPQQLQDEATVDALVRIGVVRPDPLRLFAELFQAFVLAESADGAGIDIDPRRRQVWVDGRPLKAGLSPLEFGLLSMLARHDSQVCSRDEIIRELYGERAGDTNDERLDTIVKRLREALGEDARNPRYLITHRGVGFQLVRGRLTS